MVPVTHDIIKAHGGEIIIGSNAGEGVEFIVQLPLKENINKMS